MKDIVRKVIKAKYEKFSNEFHEYENISKSYDVIHRYIKRFELKNFHLYNYKSMRIGLHEDDFKNNTVSIVIEFETRFEIGGIAIKTLG